MGTSDDSLWTRQLRRWSGGAAIFGGLLFVLAAVLHSLEPPGCVGLECDTRAMRSATGIVPVVAPAAAILIPIGVAGLTLVASQSSPFRKLANAGVFSAAAGLALLVLGGLIQAVFFKGDFPWMPLIVLPGLLGISTGFVLIGIFILRSGALPGWLGIFLLASSVALLAANEQTAAVLLAIPFGLAIATVGIFMWTTGDRPYVRATAPS